MAIKNGWKFQIANHFDKDLKNPNSDTYLRSAGFKAWEVVDGKKELVAAAMVDKNLHVNELKDSSNTTARTALAVPLLQYMTQQKTEIKGSRDPWTTLKRIHAALGSPEDFVDNRERWEEGRFGKTAKIQFSRPTSN